MANLYTKTGDKGQTGLVGGSRVAKNDPRVDCYGTIDEANSMLGLAYTLTQDDYIKSKINHIQKKLFVLGAELASDEKGIQKLNTKIDAADIEYLEEMVDTVTKKTGKQTAFVIPGVNSPSAVLHVARTIIRRGERAMISAKATIVFREELYRYVNRLSDGIYALARLEETKAQEQVIRAKVEELVEQMINKETNYTPPLNLELAKQMAHHVQQKAKELNVAVVFSVVDQGGNLILLHRMENSLLASLEISQNKAYTANALKMPTEGLQELTSQNAPLYGLQYTNNGKMVIFGGGIPYVCNEQVVGGIGVSGGSVEQDIEIAKYGLFKALEGEN